MSYTVNSSQESTTVLSSVPSGFLNWQCVFRWRGDLPRSSSVLCTVVEGVVEGIRLAHHFSARICALENWIKVIAIDRFWEHPGT